MVSEEANWVENGSGMAPREDVAKFMLEVTG